MSHLPKVLRALGQLLSYPDEHTGPSVELLYVLLQDETSVAASLAEEFGAFVEQHELWQLEETFTRTFDVNPACALEVGWHLFGEEYARGMFLVRMRAELRKYGLPESVELPDHISHVLAVVAAMPDQEARRFVHACVQPAVDKMSQALEATESPYRHVINCLASVLRHTWSGGPRPPAVAPDQSDPLHAFPVADVGCDCQASCSGRVDVVPLEISHPVTAERVNSPTSIRAREP